VKDIIFVTFTKLNGKNNKLPCL